MGNDIYLQRCRGMKEEVVSGKCKPPGSRDTFIGMNSVGKGAMWVWAVRESFPEGDGIC